MIVRFFIYLLHTPLSSFLFDTETNHIAVDLSSWRPDLSLPCPTDPTATTWTQPWRSNLRKHHPCWTASLQKQERSPRARLLELAKQPKISRSRHQYGSSGKIVDQEESGNYVFHLAVCGQGTTRSDLAQQTPHCTQPRAGLPPRRAVSRRSHQPLLRPPSNQPALSRWSGTAVQTSSRGLTTLLDFGRPLLSLRFRSAQHTAA